MTTETETLSLAEATRLVHEVLTANGLPDGAAASVSRAIVAAEAEGQVGHGFSRLDDYVAQLRSGKIRADAEIRLSMASKTCVCVDAGFGFAYPALDRAIARGVDVAREYGSASMAISNSHHCGALSVQVEKFARQGLVGLMFANSPAAIAPWGAHAPVYGTNPIAFASPRANGDPLIIDLSLSRVARGKVMHAKKAGTAIPEGWALDSHGAPTTDPEAALQGSMLPIGGPKGTSLALMVEVLSAVMTGANMSADAGSFFTAEGQPPGVGQFLVAFLPADGEAFTTRLETLLMRLEAMEGTRLPGSRRADALRQARISGINVPARYLVTARSLTMGV